MKKENKLLIVAISCFFLINDKVHAATMLDGQTTIFMYAFFGILILVGICLILSKKPKNEPTNYEEKEKTYPTLKEGQKVNIKTKKDDDYTTSFDKDFIIKELPTFSFKLFYNDIEATFLNLLTAKDEHDLEELKDKISEPVLANIDYQNQSSNLKIVNKNIIDFQKKTDYFEIKVAITIEDEQGQTKDYEVLFHNNRHVSKYNTCPNCGGKIKDPTLLRCNYCSYILPQATPEQIWVLSSYQETEKAIA